MSETSEENKDRWAIQFIHLSTHSFLSILAIQVICTAINRPVEVVI